MDYACSARSGIPPHIGRVFRGGAAFCWKRMDAGCSAGSKRVILNPNLRGESQCDAYCSEYPASPGIWPSNLSTFIVGLPSLRSVKAIAPGKIVMASFCIPTEGRVRGVRGLLHGA